MNITGLTKSQLFLNPELTREQKLELDTKLSRLKKGEPIEYIINNAEFYGYDFYVDNRVLIPRNDTEIMVDEVLKINTQKSSYNFLPNEEIKLQKNIVLIDLGTGSGCIPISIIKNSEIRNIFAIDISKDALNVAKINVENNNLQDKVNLLESNLLKVFLDKKEIKLDKNIIITANLPYIKDKDYNNMDKSVIKYEPQLALYGGYDTGFEIYEELIEQCFRLKEKYKLDSLVLFIEIGFDQYEYSKKYLEKLGLNSEYFKDNSGIYRCIKVEI